MNRNLTCLLMCCGMLALMSLPAHAQVLRIQQPIVQQFSVGTTVTVPDRGTALLGGVSSGRIHSRQVGPFRRGSIYGQEFQSTTSSVSVYIHDFEAMDRYLLNSAPRSIREAAAHPSDHWRDQLHAPEAHNQPGSSIAREKQAASQARTQAKAQRFYELGKQAEQKHVTSNIAILHYTAAAKYGSLPAQQRLKELKAESTSISAKE